MEMDNGINVVFKPAANTTTSILKSVVHFNFQVKLFKKYITAPGLKKKMLSLNCDSHLLCCEVNPFFFLYKNFQNLLRICEGVSVFGQVNVAL